MNGINKLIDVVLADNIPKILGKTKIPADENEIKDIFISSHLKDIVVEKLTTINKDIKEYDVFIIKGTK